MADTLHTVGIKHEPVDPGVSRLTLTYVAPAQKWCVHSGTQNHGKWELRFVEVE